MKKELTNTQRIEKSLITTYKKSIWTNFVAAIKEYELIQDGDKIAVCISGGKDSFIMAKLFQELKKHGKNNFELEFLIINPGYNEINTKIIEENAKALGVPIKMFNANIFDYVASVKEGSPCYLCARMRRGILYSRAKELGCNKIALGHHFDDVVETTLMSMLYNGTFKTMMPKLHSKNYEGLELIRPLYKVREKDIINWKKYSGLNFINCACRFTETCVIDEETGGSKRKEMKRLVAYLESINPIFADNIFTSLKNVNLNTILGYTKNKEKIFFLDDYDTVTEEIE